MSALLEFTNRPEQPRVPPPDTALRTTTFPSEQPAKQPKPPAQTAPFKYIQWQVPNRQVPPDFALPGLEDAYAIEYRATVAALNEQVRLLEHAKPPEHLGDFRDIQWERSNREVRQDLSLNELEKVYVFEDRSAVAAFIERNRLRGLLLAAQDPLNAAFGEAAVRRLAVMEDDEGFNALLCLIMMPGDLHEARRALRSFDRRWWLARSGQAAGKLNFDFELV